MLLHRPTTSFLSASISPKESNDENEIGEKKRLPNSLTHIEGCIVDDGAPAAVHMVDASDFLPSSKMV